MSAFQYPIEIAARPEGPYEHLDAWVDTGSVYSWVPSPVLQRLGLSPTGQRPFQVADGRLIERDIVEAVVKIDGQAAHTICVFGGEQDLVLLGAYALEGLGLAADPVNKRLVPMPVIPALTASPTSDLATRHCAPCEGGTKPMAPTAAEAYLAQVPGWHLVPGEPLKIARRVRLKDFAQAMAFVDRVAELAEAEGHHPDFCVSWNRVSLELLTHAIGGLSENDFIMAAKINQSIGG